MEEFYFKSVSSRSNLWNLRYNYALKRFIEHTKNYRHLELIKKGLHERNLFCHRKKIGLISDMGIRTDIQILGVTEQQEFGLSRIGLLNFIDDNNALIDEIEVAIETCCPINTRKLRSSLLRKVWKFKFFIRSRKSPR